MLRQKLRSKRLNRQAGALQLESFQIICERSPDCHPSQAFHRDLFHATTFSVLFCWLWRVDARARSITRSFHTSHSMIVGWHWLSQDLTKLKIATPSWSYFLPSQGNRWAAQVARILNCSVDRGTSMPRRPRCTHCSWYHDLTLALRQKVRSIEKRRTSSQQRLVPTQHRQQTASASGCVWSYLLRVRVLVCAMTHIVFIESAPLSADIMRTQPYR